MAGWPGLYRFFGLFAGPEQAELLMRLAWPLLCLGVALAAMMSIARTLAGEPGVLASGFIAMLGFQVYIRNLPGIIDHHSVQLMLVLLVLAFAVASERKPGVAAVAGVLTAIALAVGLELIVFLTIIAAAVAVRFVLDAKQGRALAAYSFGLTVGLIGIYVGTVAPANWLNTACDALGFNLAAPLAVAGLVVAVLALRLPPQKRGSPARGNARHCGCCRFNDLVPSATLPGWSVRNG